MYCSRQEECDEVDNDCDGEIDEGVTTTFYLDSDEDGMAHSQPGEYCSALLDMSIIHRLQ